MVEEWYTDDSRLKSEKSCKKLYNKGFSKNSSYLLKIIFNYLGIHKKLIVYQQFKLTFVMKRGSKNYYMIESEKSNIFDKPHWNL